MLGSAGALMALDDRNSFDTPLGGILQSANYISGLSGSSWLLGSLAMQNFTTVEEVVFENPYDLWNLTESRQLVNQTNLWKIILPVIGNNLTSALSFMNFGVIINKVSNMIWLLK